MILNQPKTISHWKYKGKLLKEFPDDSFGFVYIITNKKSGMQYVGRKYFQAIRRTKVVGRKRRKVIKKDSGWKTYTGSSKRLNLDIEKLGKENFKFEILILGETRGQVNYLEENIHHKLHVSARDKFYNDCIGPRRFSNVRLSEKIFKKINTIKFS